MGYRNRACYLAQTRIWCIFSCHRPLLRRELPFTHDGLIALLGMSKTMPFGWQIESVSPKGCRELPRGSRSDTPAPRHARTADSTALQARSLLHRPAPLYPRLMELSGHIPDELPLEPGDIWSDAAIAEIRRAG